MKEYWKFQVNTISDLKRVLTNEGGVYDEEDFEEMSDKETIDKAVEMFQDTISECEFVHGDLDDKRFWVELQFKARFMNQLLDLQAAYA